jgi:hypothetical protein
VFLVAARERWTFTGWMGVLEDKKDGEIVNLSGKTSQGRQE